MTLAERLRAAAAAENIRTKITRNHLDGMVRWKGKRSDLGPYLLRVLQTGDDTHTAFEVVRTVFKDGYFVDQTGPIIAHAGSTNDAIRAGLLVLAEREEAKP